MSSYPERSSVIKQSNVKFVGREECELRDSRQAVLSSNSVLFLALISWSRKVSSAAAYRVFLGQIPEGIRAVRKLIVTLPDNTGSFKLVLFF
jgi:hypothetical protein